MNWSLGAILFVSGICVGVLFAPREKVTKTNEIKSVNTVTKSVRQTTPIRNSKQLLESVLSDGRISSELLNGLEKPEDWIELIAEAIPEQNGLFGAAGTSGVDLNLLLTLVPEEHLEEVLLGMRENSIDTLRWVGFSTINPAERLVDRWYQVNPEAVRNWAMSGDPIEGRIEILVASALKRNPAEGLELYHSYKDQLRTHSVIGRTLESNAASAVLKTEGVEAYWEYLKTNTHGSNLLRTYQWIVPHDLKPEQFESFYEIGARSTGIINKDAFTPSFFKRWAKIESDGLEAWYSNNQDNLSRREKSNVLRSLAGKNKEEFISAQLLADGNLIDGFLENENAVYVSNVFRAADEVKLKLLPEDLSINTEMVYSGIASLNYNLRLEDFSLAQYISDPQERFEALKKVAKPIYKRPPADMKVLESEIAKLDISVEQQAEILEIAGGGVVVQDSHSPK